MCCRESYRREEEENEVRSHPLGPWGRKDGRKECIRFVFRPVWGEGTALYF